MIKKFKLSGELYSYEEEEAWTEEPIRRIQAVRALDGSIITEESYSIDAARELRPDLFSPEEEEYIPEYKDAHKAREVLPKKFHKYFR